MKLRATHSRKGVICFPELVEFMCACIPSKQSPLKESTTVVVFSDNIFMMLNLDLNSWLGVITDLKT